MKKYGKAGLLIITLVIPALIFTFLRFFATNHYNIPFYHPLINTEGKIQTVDGDTVFYTIPVYAGLNLQGKLTVVSNMPGPCNEPCVIMSDNLQRIHSLKESMEGLRIITLLDSNSQLTEKVRNMENSIVEMNTTTRDSIFKWNQGGFTKKTGLAEYRWILVDRQGHIRGYYNGADREETDRLMAELKILSFEEKNLKQ